MTATVVIVAPIVVIITIKNIIRIHKKRKTINHYLLIAFYYKYLNLFGARFRKPFKIKDKLKE